MRKRTFALGAATGFFAGLYVEHVVSDALERYAMRAFEEEMMGEVMDALEPQGTHPPGDRRS